VIKVSAKLKSENEVQFEVEDDGIGFTPAKLALLEAELADDSGEIKMESGFGIGNVNRRIRLYYGKQYGVSVRSEYNSGTCVTLVIPAIKQATAENGSSNKNQDEPVASGSGWN
jgi:two-component system, sensor histidine kinase YesM